VLSVFIGVGVPFSVITGEKTQRLTEAIVSAVSPQVWIDGKTLGTSLFVPVRMLAGSVAAWEVAAALALLAGSVLPRGRGARRHLRSNAHRDHDDPWPPRPRPARPVRYRLTCARASAGARGSRCWR
jgi:hypothetical protein